MKKKDKAVRDKIKIWLALYHWQQVDKHKSDEAKLEWIVDKIIEATKNPNGKNSVS